MMITVLSGGTGSIKLIRGLRFLEENITIVVNIGDNKMICLTATTK